MKFSVITCTWNSEKFLRQSIESVLQQTHEDVEYIFVDGGSTDATLSIIGAIQKPVTIIPNVRGGISRAMNQGILAAKGDVIVHLHSDDYFAHPQVLADVAKSMSERNEEWLFGRCLSDVAGVVSVEKYTVPRYSYQQLLRGNFIPHPATFIRRKIYSEVGLFDENIKYAMDYDMWLRIAKRFRPIQLDVHLSVFRWHENSLTSANREASLNDDLKVRLRHIEKFSMPIHLLRYLVRRSRLRKSLRNGGKK